MTDLWGTPPRSYAQWMDCVETLRRRTVPAEQLRLLALGALPEGEAMALRLEPRLTEGAQLFLDDEILTSGSGGMIPQGIVIGSVVSIQSEAGGQTEYGIIEPAADLDTLVQVFIIKEFDVVD